MAWHLGSFLIFLTASKAWSYPTPVDFDGTLMRWNIGRTNPSILLEVVADRPEDLNIFSEAVAESAQLWTDVPTSYFKFVPTSAGETAQVTVNLKSAQTGGTYSAGYAIFDGYDDQSPPRPTHCSIFVGITDDQSYYAISKTILHELGHCVGLGHTLIPEAIMSYSLDKNSYALDIDDEAAVSRLYPQDGSRPRLPPGCSIGVTQTSTTNILAFALFTLPLLIATTRSRKQPPGSVSKVSSKA